MVALLHRGLRQQAPTGPVEVDWSHPLAQGLALCVLFGNDGRPREVARRAPVTLAGDATPSTRGVATTTTGYAQLATSVAPMSLLTSPAGMTAVWSGRQDVVSATPQCYIGAGDAVGYPVSLEMRPTTTTFGDPDNTKILLARSIYPGTTLSLWRSTQNQLTAGAPLTAMSIWATDQINATPILFVNGINQVMTSVLVNSGTAGQGAALRIGGQNSGDRFLNGLTRYAMFWSRDLTHSEARWHYQEPYAFLLQGVHRRIFLMGEVVSTFRPQVIVA